MSSKEAFTAQIEYFSKFYRVTAFDFLGFGGAKPLTEAFSVSDYAEWTREVFSLLGVEKPLVIAHSFGCRVAVKTEAEYRGSFEKILLTGPAGIIVNRGFSYSFKVKTYKIVKKVFPSFASRAFGSREYRSLSDVMKESYKKIVNEDLRSYAEKIVVPTLIVQGRQDETTTEKEARIYLDKLQNAKLVFTDGGHFSFAENPLAFNLIAEDFFSNG